MTTSRAAAGRGRKGSRPLHPQKIGIAIQARSRALSAKKTKMTADRNIEINPVFCEPVSFPK